MKIYLGEKMGRTSKATNALSSLAKRTLHQLGNHLKTARKRRGITQQELALRASISPVTLGKLERGDASVGLSSLLMVLDVLDLLEDLSLVAHPNRDEVGKALDAANVPQRVRRKGFTNKKLLDF